MGVRTISVSGIVGGDHAVPCRGRAGDHATTAATPHAPRHQRAEGDPPSAGDLAALPQRRDQTTVAPPRVAPATNRTADAALDEQ
jgi:uncharacterized membrane protein